MWWRTKNNESLGRGLGNGTKARQTAKSKSRSSISGPGPLPKIITQSTRSGCWLDTGGQTEEQIGFASRRTDMLTSAMSKIRSFPKVRFMCRAVFLAILLFICCYGVLAQNNAPSLDQYFSQARALEGSQNYSGAEQIYLDADKSFPHNPEVLKRLGIIYQTELKFSESINTFQQVLKIDEKYPEVSFYVGLSYFGLNQYDKAIAAFDKQLEIDPKYRRAHYFEAQVYQSLNRNADAMRQYEVLLAQDPTDKKALYQLIRFLKATTLQAIDQLGNLDPNSIYIMVLKAESNTQVQEYAKAIDQYHQVLAQDPNFPGIHFALGEDYYGKVDYPNAEKELRLALQEDPNHPKANYYLADILVKGGRLNEAVPLLELSVPADPGFMKGYFLLGKCYASQGKLPEALKLLEKATELEPDDKNVHYQLAQLYMKLNEPDKSHEQMEIFQKLYAEERQKKAEKLDENQRRMATPSDQQ
jgi:tetratricopeptide (TPR) repeat protein